MTYLRDGDAWSSPSLTVSAKAIRIVVPRMLLARIRRNRDTEAG